MNDSRVSERYRLSLNEQANANEPGKFKRFGLFALGLIGAVGVLYAAEQHSAENTPADLGNEVHFLNPDLSE